MFYKNIKRLFDICLSLVGILILSPVMLLLVVLIKLDSKGSIIFLQKRVGKNKVHFNIYKFRTMKTLTPDNTPTHLLDNPEKWITRVGRLLRKTSLDELPQFFNILKGDMSFVGPRPALWNQYDLIEERDKYNANSILPGVTGWAQVNGRDELLIQDKAKLDGEYMNRISFAMDIKIVLKTFFVVFKSKGVLEGGTGSNTEKK